MVHGGCSWSSCRSALAYFEKEGKLLEAQRLRMSTTYDSRDDAGDRFRQRHRVLLQQRRTGVLPGPARTMWRE